MMDYKMPVSRFNQQNGGTFGSRAKYYRESDNCWYKLDSLEYGNNSVAEALVSLVLDMSNIPHTEYVYYERCKVNGTPASKSESFFHPGKEEFIPLSRLGILLDGGKVPDIKSGFTRESINDVLRWGERINADLKRPLYTALLIDMLTLDTGRSADNMGVIYSQNSWTGYRKAPYFNYGHALCTGIPATKINDILNKPNPLEVFLKDNPLVGFVQFSYKGIFKILDRYWAGYAEANVLKAQLDKYRSIFDNGK